MGRAPAFQFYPADWLSDPQLKLASASTKGIWIDLLCYMWKANERGKIYGSLDQLCRMTGSTEDEMTLFINEANSLKFADVTICNENVTIVNRRMVREEKERISTRQRVQRHRNAEMKRECNENVTPPSSSSSSSSCTKVHYSTESGCFQNISKPLLDKWREAYPAIDIHREIQKAEAWVQANPKNKKSNWERFLNNWLSRAQDKAPPIREPVYIPPPAKPTTFVTCPRCKKEIAQDDLDGDGCIYCAPLAPSALANLIGKIGKPI